MYTLIIIENVIQIEVGSAKEDLTLLLNTFLKDKIITNGTTKGHFNGLEMLASKVVQFLENEYDKEEFRSSVWVHDKDKDVSTDEQVVIKKGSQIILSENEIVLIKKGQLDSQNYGTMHESFKIEVDDKCTIKDMKKFKLEFKG